LKDEQKSRALATIERNARAQTQLIDDLLNASQVISGRLRLDRAGVNLAEVVRSVVELAQPAVDDKRLTLKTTIDGAIGPISGDPDRLRQVVWNLLSNAVKFTPAGGRIDVRLERVGEYGQLTVRDSGAGISPEFLPHVFEHFRQQDAGTTRQHGGLGLGLALVRHVVELHGGSIQAESAGNGRGATFRVRLPLKILELSRPAGTVRLGDERLDGVRVLIVDSQAAPRTLLASAILRVGGLVTTAASARDAVKMLTADLPDVLVVSFGMPEDEGQRLARDVSVLTADRGERLKVIALGGSAADGNETRRAESGVAQHLPRPVEPERLVSAIAALTAPGVEKRKGDA
jgi:CheY-like chemotaxis protein